MKNNNTLSTAALGCVGFVCDTDHDRLKARCSASISRSKIISAWLSCFFSQFSLYNGKLQSSSLSSYLAVNAVVCISLLYFQYFRLLLVCLLNKTFTTWNLLSTRHNMTSLSLLFSVRSIGSGAAVY